MTLKILISSTEWNSNREEKNALVGHYLKSDWQEVDGLFIKFTYIRENKGCILKHMFQFSFVNY